MTTFTGYNRLIGSVCGLALLLGCDDPLLCDRETATLDVRDAIDAEWLELYRDTGWSCKSNDGGFRYECEICR